MLLPEAAMLSLPNPWAGWLAGRGSPARLSPAAASSGELPQFPKLALCN